MEKDKINIKITYRFNPNYPAATSSFQSNFRIDADIRCRVGKI